jgi:hypothetical protein
MEVYVNSKEVDRTVFLPFPETPASVDVFVYRDGVEIGELSTVTVGAEGIEAVLPFRMVQDDQRLELRWIITFEEDGEIHTIKKSTPIEVVTPILTNLEIISIMKEEWSQENPTQEEITSIEKAVRHIINAHTGQTFGKFVGVREVSGNGGTAILMPQRLIELTDVDGDSTNRYLVASDGYIMRFYPWGIPPVKADAYGLHMHTGGVIHNPNNVKMAEFASTRTFRINGVWGWDEVPAPVKEAAKLLVNDYACADSQYRDRFLSTMTAADWRIAFDSRAWIGTGNVRADQLLSGFVLNRGWAVL